MTNSTFKKVNLVKFRNNGLKKVLASLVVITAMLPGVSSAVTFSGSNFGTTAPTTGMSLDFGFSPLSFYMDVENGLFGGTEIEYTTSLVDKSITISGDVKVYYSDPYADQTSTTPIFPTATNVDLLALQQAFGMTLSLTYSSSVSNGNYNSIGVTDNAADETVYFAKLDADFTGSLSYTGATDLGFTDDGTFAEASDFPNEKGCTLGDPCEFIYDINQFLSVDIEGMGYVGSAGGYALVATADTYGNRGGDMDVKGFLCHGGDWNVDPSALDANECNVHTSTVQFDSKMQMVPEPSTLFLGVAGLMGLLISRRKVK